jgi:hemolysin D
MTTDELAFLPAALEIQDTPPLPVSRYILRAILLFFTFAITWACIGEVDIVGVAQGKIIPGGKVKIIQPLEPGVVRTILVKEGEEVQAGQVLVELDSTLTGADHASIKEQLLALKLDRARILTLLDTINKGQVTNDQGQMTHDYFTELKEASNAQLRLQQDRLHAQLNDYYAQTEALKEEQKQRAGERAAVADRIQQLEATIPLITERATALEDLMKKSLVPRVQWLELEQQRIEQVKERDVQNNTLGSLGAGIANIQQRLTAQQAEFGTKLLTELTDTENRIAALEQENVKAEQRMTLQKLTAPVVGKVHQLAVHTIGGVVTPAQELMHIVPDAGDLEVEAWLPNKDIGFVVDGQAAVLKVETFPFTLYGTIDAEVIHVSNDATPDEHLGLVYAMRVKMRQTTMQVKEKIVNLTPGMAVTVEVKMGKRRLIEFLLSPLLKYKDEAARER